MTITFKGILMIILAIETCLWIRTSLKSYDRGCEIEKLKDNNNDLLNRANRERCRSEEYGDIITKRDNELSIERKKYKKCIEYINKINEEYKIK